MPDYELSRLATRTFEQLIQALSIKIIGPGLIVFGDGRDGGREATYEGTIPFPSTEQKWQGYLVIQAKFKQRPLNTGSDVSWAIKELKDELSKFADTKKNLRTPEFYIFATNVNLSSVPDSGGKDKVKAVFEEFKSTVPIKDFRIWDYDQIRVFLDADQSVRRTYTAWITPGDVLSAMIDLIGSSKRDFMKTIGLYLQKELLMDQYVNLGQAGHAEEDKIQLADVFVDLPYLSTPVQESKQSNENDKQDGFVKFILEEANKLIDKPDPQDGLINNIQRAIPIIQKNYGRFVLVGGPGQGKTTVGQFIAQLFRSAILRESSLVQMSPEVKGALTDIENQCQQENLILPSAKRFPIRIVLNNFSRSISEINSGDSISLLNYMAKNISLLTDSAVTPDDLKEWLSNYPWIIIFDGLDEVPVSSNREEVLTAIQNFWVDMSALEADVIVVATTRPQGYSEDFSPRFYQHYWLSHLNNKQALHYSNRLVDARYVGDSERRKKVLSRLEKAVSHENTSRLMKSPLQITIMTTLVDQIGQPPQDRWRLFQMYYEVIYRREMERDIPAANILREYKPDIDAIHRHVGLVLQTESEYSGNTQSYISKNKFEKIVVSRLEDEKHEGEQLESLKNAIIDAAVERLVFLVGPEVDKAGFEIRSLQEFMAAEALLDGSDDDVRKRLTQISKSTHWENVFLFAAGKCFVERQYLRDTIHSICGQLNEDPDDEVLRTLKYGSSLASLLLEDGPARRQPKYSQCFARIAFDSVKHRRSPVNLGADVYEDSLKDIYQEELRLILANKNSDYKEVAWKILISLANAKIDWAIDLANELWPDEQEERINILIEATAINLHSASDALNYQWYINKWKECAFKVNPIKSIFAIISFRNYGPEEINLFEEPYFSPINFFNIFADKKENKIEIRLKEHSTSYIKTTFESIDSRLKKYAENILKIETDGDTWKFWKSISNFICNPAPETLSKELYAISKLNDDEGSRLAFMDLPWPIKICLKFASSPDDLVRFADACEKGYFGTSDDWIEAEARWSKFGVSDQDLIYCPKHELPFDDNIASTGFPFGITYTRCEGDTADIEKIIESLIEIFKNQTNKYSKHGLAEVIEYLVPLHDIDESLHLGDSNLDLIREIVSYWSKGYIDLYKIISLIIGMANKSLILEFLDQVGNNYFNKMYWSGEEPNEKEKKLFDSICSEIQKDDQKLGLLKILSIISDSYPDIEIPKKYLKLSNFNDNESKISAASLIFTTEQFDKSDFDDVTNLLSEKPDGDTHLSHRIFRNIENSKQENSIKEEFLLHLFNTIFDTHPHFSKRIISELITIVRKRTSKLNDIRVWRKLNLPLQLHATLDT